MPWPHVAIDMAAVRAGFAAHGPPGPPVHDGPTVLERAGGGRPSAVLVPLFEEDGLARVILTRRSPRLRSHTHQVAFPGGRLEAAEAPLAAALREATEEIGLDPSVCEVLGELSGLTTMTSAAVITPFVAALPGRPELRPDPAEVERVFDVALSELLEEEVYREEHWPFGAGHRPVYFFHLDGDTVWGATARMLHELLGVVVPAAGGA